MTYSIGTDSGSTATKGILLTDDVTTHHFFALTPLRPATVITEAWKTLREGLETTPFLTLTDYGQQLVDFAGKQATEIPCHRLGAWFLEPATRAVIGIGDQNSKVVQLGDDGNLCDFLMNDKCAADTGRFLEAISRMLGTSAEQLNSIAENAVPHVITGMCTVFAEPEVISLCSAGVAPEATPAGMINAVTRRGANFIARLSCEAPILLTGGVSHCQRFTHMLGNHLGMSVQTHSDAQFAGTTDAAVIGQRRGKRARKSICFYFIPRSASYKPAGRYGQRA